MLHLFKTRLKTVLCATASYRIKYGATVFIHVKCRTSSFIVSFNFDLKVTVDAHFQVCFQTVVIVMETFKHVLLAVITPPVHTCFVCVLT